MARDLERFMLSIDMTPDCTFWLAWHNELVKVNAPARRVDQGGWLALRLLLRALLALLLFARCELTGWPDAGPRSVGP